MKPETRKAQQHRWYQRYKEERLRYARDRRKDPAVAAAERAYHLTYNRQWYATHKEQRAVYNRHWYATHKEQRGITRRHYHATHTREIRARGVWYRWWKRYEWQPLPTIEVSCLY